jgi:uncharacterized membrane protein
MAFEFPQLAYPLVLLLISPVILAGWYAVRKGIPKLLMVSRVVILSLLIIALASPYTLGTTTITDQAPMVTIVSDQTLSMDLFNKNLAQTLYDSIKSSTPTTFKQFSGITSPIGDEVIQDATGNNNIVLVSDLNNNYGKDLSEAITFVNNTGTRVFAVKQTPVHNDASVEIQSAKNLIIGNPNEFNIVVRQAGNETSYKLDVDIDGTSVLSQIITQTDRIQNTTVSYTFNSLGTHKVTATITPTSEDYNPLNNVFYKSVFVVPKPQVLAVTDDTTSPLYTIASSLYQVTNSSDVPDDLSPYKAIIIDNKDAGQLSANMDSLRKYVSSGGGLVVVGGDNAYNYPPDRSYNNSDFESLLPVISKGAKSEGGNNIVILIDSSGSTSLGTPPVNSYIDANALYIVQNIAGDTNVAVVAFGGAIAKTGLLSMSSPANKETLNALIRQITPSGGENPTDIDNGLRNAETLLDSVSGTKEIIVLSDGLIQPDGLAQIKNTVSDLKNKGYTMHFVQMLTLTEAKVANDNYNQLAMASDTQVLLLSPGDSVGAIIGPPPSTTPTPTSTPEISHEFPLVLGPQGGNHFITQYLNLTASVTGYNDVTSKLGSDELVAAMTATGGKPILTTWGFGLGRVVSFSTDNGNPSSNDPSRPWASQVYSGENSRLISAMINWAIGDPRPTGDVVIQADDIWGGTPGKVVVTSDTLPQVQLDGAPLDLSRTGPTTYETSINLEKAGFHDLSGYGIAVNYPLEYRDVGFNDQLTTVIEANGGSVYDESEVEGLLLLDIKEKAVRTVQEPMSQKEPFLLAALGLFLTEVIIRRLKDYRKERPVIEDNPPRVAPASEPETAG